VVKGDVVVSIAADVADSTIIKHNIRPTNVPSHVKHVKHNVQAEKDARYSYRVSRNIPQQDILTHTHVTHLT